MKPRGRFRGRLLLIGVGDAVLGMLVYCATVWLRRTVPVPFTTDLLAPDKVPLDVFPWLLIVAVTVVLALFLAGTYDETSEAVRRRGGLLIASGVTAAALIAVYFGSGRAVPRSVLLIYLPFLALALAMWRRLADLLAPIGLRQVLVMGSGEDARHAVDALRSGEIVGHTLHDWWPDLAPLRRTVAAEPGAFEVPRNAADIVYASDLPEDRTVLVSLLEHSLQQQFDLWILPGLTDIVASRPLTRNLGDLPLVHVARRGVGPFAAIYRRSMDLVCGSVLLVVALPILVVVSVAVMVESPGLPWIRQRRVGQHGKEFGFLKIRTMIPGAEEMTGPTKAQKNDFRRTRVGRYLRQTRLDELPQLLHVLSGKMSLIGPRPERPEFVANYVKDVPAYRLRHVLKPGITGLAQVMGAYATRPEVKLRYDLAYLFHMNPLLDLFILMKTISTVLRGNGT